MKTGKNTKSKKTETLKDCLTDPSFIQDMKNEKRFPVMRPYYDTSIEMLELLYESVVKNAQKIKKHNSKLNKKIKELKIEQKELDRGGYKMGSPEIDRSLDLYEQIEALENRLKPALNQVYTMVELKREYGRRHRKDYKEKHKIFLDVLTLKEKEIEKKMEERVYWAMKNIEDAIRKGREEIKDYGTRKVSGTEMFNKNLKSLIKTIKI